MRFQVRTSNEKYKELFAKDWHPWFAWHPVRLDSHTIVWLERVKRKAIPGKTWDTQLKEYRYKVFWEYDWWV